MKAHFIKNHLFLIISVLLLLGGFLSGIILGYSNPVTVLNDEVLSDYSDIYDSISDEETVTKTFNISIMFETWISSILNAAFFYAIHLHLSNQRNIILTLKNPQKLTNPGDDKISQATAVDGSQCSLCKRDNIPLKPARYISNNQTYYIQACEDCFKNYECEDLM